MINKSEKEIIEKWQGSIDHPIVSIRCSTYNHELYIEDAIDSFLKQETNFPFEIIIHDDASTDNTANLVKKYEIKYPSIIKAVYEDENQLSKHNRFVILHMLNEKTKGKYIASCEGDDYWIDNYKLQKEVDYLEKHPECSLVLTSCYEEYGNGVREENRPFDKSGILSHEDVILEKKKLPPTCSMIFPSIYEINMPDFYKLAPVGDKPRRLYLNTVGYIYFLDEITCVHRNDVNGSFAKRVSNDADYAKYIYDGMIEFYNKYNEHTNYKYEREISYAKDKEEYYFYIRTKNKKKFLKCNYFRKYARLKTKIKTYLSFYLPDRIKNIIKKIIKK